LISTDVAFGLKLVKKLGENAIFQFSSFR